MRKDILNIIKQYKHEIVISRDLFEKPYIQDWFHYLDDCVLNVHDYDEDYVLNINAYSLCADGSTNWEDMFLDARMTLEEFNTL